MEPGNPSGKPDAHRAPNQLLAILNFVARSEHPVQMKEILAQLAVPRSSAFRLVDELTEGGWLVASGSPRRYSASWRTTTLGLAAVTHHPVRNLVFPLLVGLAEETKLPANLAFYEDGEVVFADVAEVVGDRVIHSHSTGRISALVSAAGRAMLAFQPADEVERALARDIPRYTEYTKTDPDDLRREIARARERGVAIAIQEVYPDSVGIASAIIDERGVGVAAFSLHNYAGTPDPAFIASYSSALTRWTRRASIVLGSRLPPRLS